VDAPQQYFLTRQFYPEKQERLRRHLTRGATEGKVKKTISVLSNDPNTPNHKLSISGEVIEEISFKPKNINFGNFRADNQSDKTVKFSVKSQSGPDFKIDKITSSKHL